MSQPNPVGEQLGQYLAQLAPQLRARLLAELERLHALGQEIPRLDELIATLRAELVASGQAIERLSDPARIFFQPLEPVLIDGAPEHANSGQIARGSLGPIWNLLSSELLSTMSREYVANVSKVIANRKEAEKLAAVFQKKALGYLEGTMRSAEGAAMIRAGLRMYTSSPAMFDDLVKMFTVFRASEALATFDRDIPPKIGKLEGRALDTVLDRLKALKAKHADAIPFALTIVAGRLNVRSHLIHLATKVIETKAAAAVAATPYAVTVSMLLDQVEERERALRVAVRNNRIVIAKDILRDIYAMEAALKAQIELDGSDWARRLHDSMAAVASILAGEVQRSGADCGSLSHVLASSDLRPAQSLKERFAQAIHKGRIMLADVMPG